VEILGYVLYAGLVMWTAGCFVLAWRWNSDVDVRYRRPVKSPQRGARVVKASRW
jgi:hypothetical protein